MKTTECFSTLLKERYKRIDHDSGLRIYLFPKKMTSIYALFAVQYGSVDSSFSVDGESVTVPDGIAHFLEHKLFDCENGEDAFARFSAIGADANAYTAYNRTAYLFSCTEHFSEALRELVDFVTHPYFTDASVKKEQGIIAEEIRMYEDSPWERVYQNLLAALYHVHPVRKNICGTVKSIKKITPALLYQCYEAFYQLSNMALIVCGDIEEGDILSVVDEILPSANDRVRQAAVRILPTEPQNVARERIEARMQVAKPIFSIGIKDDAPPTDPTQRLRRDLCMSLLNEILFSQAGEFYSTLFEEGLITPSFSYGYSSAEGFAFNCITGESNMPDTVLERLRQYVTRMCREGLSDEAFERCRRALYSDEIRAYDSTEEIANRLLSFVFEGSEMFSVPHILLSISRAELEALMRSFFGAERYSMSVILPSETAK
ncbi:MAG: insulinase family protein [Clostridia bacterium]|nr:insulinase family protein [Clostridia bacterium]